MTTKSMAREVAGVTLAFCFGLIGHTFIYAAPAKIAALSGIITGGLMPVIIMCLGVFGLHKYLLFRPGASK